MINCPSCDAENTDETLFCRKCGARLDPLPRSKPAAVGSDTLWTGHDLNQSAAAHAARETRLFLHLIIEEERELEVTLDKPVHLGRLDPAAGVFPEIDLTLEGAGKGVSRQHARIYKHDRRVVVEDVGSTNGTFLNGRRLAPYLSEPLNDGDLLQLGRLLIKTGLRKK